MRPRAASQRLNRKTVPCIDGATPEETALNFANLMISPEMASFRSSPIASAVS